MPATASGSATRRSTTTCAASNPQSHLPTKARANPLAARAGSIMPPRGEERRPTLYVFCLNFHKKSEFYISVQSISQKILFFFFYFKVKDGMTLCFNVTSNWYLSQSQHKTRGVCQLILIIQPSSFINSSHFLFIHMA